MESRMTGMCSDIWSSQRYVVEVVAQEIISLRPFTAIKVEIWEGLGSSED